MLSMTSPPQTAHTTARPHTPCAGDRVGVIALDERGRIRLGIDGDATGGLAPLSAHVDAAQPDPRRAALAETAAAGLSVTAMVQVAGGHRADRCDRGGPDGHRWSVYRARVVSHRPDPDADPEAGAVDGVRWADAAQLRALAARTIDHARGVLRVGEWETSSGLSLVWVRWLQTAGLLTVPRHALEEIEDALTRSPYVWIDDPEPGGTVCGHSVPAAPDGICGQPVESEPCTEHGPEYGSADGEAAR